MACLMCNRRFEGCVYTDTEGHSVCTACRDRHEDVCILCTKSGRGKPTKFFMNVTLNNMRFAAAGNCDVCVTTRTAVWCETCCINYCRECAAKFHKGQGFAHHATRSPGAAHDGACETVDR